jgi:hypothetical protein
MGLMNQRKTLVRPNLPFTVTDKMPSGYTTRDVADPSQIKKNKQSMADLKLRRLTELNNRLREDLERDRIPVSQAAKRSVAIMEQHSEHNYGTHSDIFITALSHIRIPPRTSWFRLFGALWTRRTTHMRQPRVGDAVRSCRTAMHEVVKAFMGIGIIYLSYASTVAL